MRLKVLSASKPVALRAKARSISGTGGSPDNSEKEYQTHIAGHKISISFQASE